MATPNTHYVRPGHSEKIKPVSVGEGEVFNLKLDFNNYLGTENTTVSSACAECDSGTVDISAPTIATGVVTVPCTASSAGRAMLTICTTMTDGSVVIRYWYVTVIDPAGTTMADYQS